MRLATLVACGMAVTWLALPPCAAAQDGSLRLGVLAGLSSAKLSSDFDESGVEMKRLSSVTGGLSLELRLAKPLFLDVRGLWVRKGFKLEDPEEPGLEVRAEVDYVSVPILLKLKGGDQVRPYLAAGPELGFKTSARTKVSLDGETEEEDIGEDVESTDLALQALAGVEFSLARLSLFVEAGLSHGLRDIAKDEGGDSLESSKNRTFLLQAGIRF